MVILAADTTDTFVGDGVIYSSAGADSTGKYPAVVQGAAGGPFAGVITSIEPLPLTSATSDDLRNLYVEGAGTVDRYVQVDVDPNTIYEIQEVSGGTALTASAVNLNASVVVGSGNTSTGASGMELDNTTEATTAGLELRILGLVDREDNALGEHAKWLVRINDHQGANGTAGV